MLVKTQLSDLGNWECWSNVNSSYTLQTATKDKNDISSVPVMSKGSEG